MISTRFSLAALAALASIPLAACTIERAPAQAPPPPPAQTAPVAAATGPIAPSQVTDYACAYGAWKVQGPTGPIEVTIARGDTPGSVKFNYKGATVANGVGSMTGSNVQVDLGQASGGIYSCQIATGCATMSCGFAGQQPMVFNKPQ